MSPRIRRGIGIVRLLEALTALGLIGGLTWLLLTPVVARRNPSPRSACKNNLKQIGLALHNYHDTYQCFPPAVTDGPDGRPWHSWRVLLLPYLERRDLYDRYRFDEPWDGPHNHALVAEMPAIFRCEKDDGAAAGTTSYVAVTGEGTAWPPGGATTLGNIPDGSDRTLLVVEMSDSGVSWTRPLDLWIDAMRFAVGGSGVNPRSRHGDRTWTGKTRNAGTQALRADGSVPYLPSHLPPETLRSLLLIGDGGPADRP